MLILPDWLIVAADRPPLPRHGVRTAGGVVTDVGPNAELITTYPDELVLDAAGHVVLPGFVNAHVHLYGVLAHGIPTPPGGWPERLLELPGRILVAPGRGPARR